MSQWVCVCGKIDQLLQRPVSLKNRKTIPQIRPSALVARRVGGCRMLMDVVPHVVGESIRKIERPPIFEGSNRRALIFLFLKTTAALKLRYFHRWSTCRGTVWLPAVFSSCQPAYIVHNKNIFRVGISKGIGPVGYPYSPVDYAWNDGIPTRVGWFRMQLTECNTHFLPLVTLVWESSTAAMLEDACREHRYCPVRQCCLLLQRGGGQGQCQSAHVGTHKKQSHETVEIHRGDLSNSLCIAAGWSYMNLLFQYYIYLFMLFSLSIDLFIYYLFKYVCVLFYL